MRVSFWARPLLALVLVLVGIGSRYPSAVCADPITYSGTIEYLGAYSGDSLYVAVLDTAGTEDVTLLDLISIDVGPSPFSQSYTLNFDNTGVSSQLLIASFLDVDGGGVDDIGGADVFGWYAGGTEPLAVSSGSSQSGLDFSLPRAEIRGTVTFAAGQTEARIDVSNDVTCGMEGFRPGTFLSGTGAYTIAGVYAGSYCVSADGDVSGGSPRICFGDPTCVSPTTVTLTATEVRTGIDLDFTSLVPAERSSWGRVKALYRD